MKLAQPKIRDTEEGPPRAEGVVPLPRSERGGKRRSRSGGDSMSTQAGELFLDADQRGAEVGHALLFLSLIHI